MRISDMIENFIKEMMQEEQPEIELKRNELAEYFHCAPSQINYVLATRFTPDHGYVINSQRGGGGCIRIIRVNRTGDEHLAYLMQQRIGDTLDEQTAAILCRHLAEKGIVSAAESATMYAALSPASFSIPIPENLKNVLRARIMKNMLLSIAQRNGQR